MRQLVGPVLFFETACTDHLAFQKLWLREIVLNLKFSTTPFRARMNDAKADTNALLNTELKACSIVPQK